MKQAFSSRLHHMLKGRPHALLIATLLTVMLGFTAFAAAPAAHAASVSTATHCMVVLAPLQPGQQTSRVLSTQCVPENQPLAVPLTDTLLMRWWINANFSGTNSGNMVVGTAGPCDTTGYGIGFTGNFGSIWNDSISSFKVFNNCNDTRAYTDANFRGTCQHYSGNVGFVGGTMNDKISSFRVASTTHLC